MYVVCVCMYVCIYIYVYIYKYIYVYVYYRYYTVCVFANSLMTHFQDAALSFRTKAKEEIVQEGLGHEEKRHSEENTWDEAPRETAKPDVHWGTKKEIWKGLLTCSNPSGKA